MLCCGLAVKTLEKLDLMFSMQWPYILLGSFREKRERSETALHFFPKQMSLVIVLFSMPCHATNHICSIAVAVCSAAPYFSPLGQEPNFFFQKKGTKGDFSLSVAQGSWRVPGLPARHHRTWM